MWDLHQPKAVKLFIGILAANEEALKEAVKAISKTFGVIDFTSEVWPFTQTDYYKDELGDNPLRQFVSIEKLIDPGDLAKIKHKTNKLEEKLAKKLEIFDTPNVIASDLSSVAIAKEEAKQSQSCDNRLPRRPDKTGLVAMTKLPRPVNLDPGIIEPSKLVLATTKNYSHRIYIGNKMFAEVTLIYEKGSWQHFDYTYPDYRQPAYHDFFTKVRNRLVEQLKK